MACSILSTPFPLGLPCGWLALDAQGGIDSKRLFHVPRLSRDGLGPLCTPAVRHSRRATLESPNLTACLLAQALNSLVWLVLYDDACECLISLTLPSDSSAAPGLRLLGWLALFGRLQTFGSSLRRPPNACSHRIPAAKSRAQSEKPRGAVANATSCRG